MNIRALLIGCCAAAVAFGAELPVKKVVLYKHGVGYFERAGELAPGESARLDFQVSEMNDVLKSLTLSSSGKEGVAAVRYDASESVADQLKKLPFRLGDQKPLAALLDQLKGERLELRYEQDPSQSVEGVILGARTVSPTRERAERQEVTLLTDAGQIMKRNADAASYVRFTDPKIQAQVRDYLRVMSRGRSLEARSVYIDSVDSAARRIRASYMIPAPVWKSSYRLIFPDRGEPTLEGWAIVDNTTGDNWINQVTFSRVRYL